MPITADLQEKKRGLMDLRLEQKKRFDKANDDKVENSVKHGVLEEIKRAEPDILKLHNEVTDLEKVVIAEQQNEEALKSMKEPDRRVPFSVRDAAQADLGEFPDDHPRALGELIAQNEAIKSYSQGSGIRTQAMEFEQFKSLKDGFWNARSSEQISEAMSKLSPAEQSALKATFGTTGLTSIDRQPGILLQGVMPPTIADLIPQGETSNTTLRYLREMSFTPSAAAVAEGGLKPDSAWDVAEMDAPVRKIAVTTKVHDELFEDFPALRDYLNQRLPFMVAIEEDNQLLNGSGTSPNLRGLLNTTGVLVHAQGFQVDETTAITGDSAIDALLRAATRVQFESFFEPTGIVLNPFKWMNMRLTRTGTGDGAGGESRGMYLLGNPNEPGLQSLWGYPIRSTTRIGLQVGLVAAFNLACQIFRKKGITTDMTNANEDDFKYNRTLIRCEERLAFPVYRPQAICKVVFNGIR